MDKPSVSPVECVFCSDGTVQWRSVFFDWDRCVVVRAFAAPDLDGLLDVMFKWIEKMERRG